MTAHRVLAAALLAAGLLTGCGAAAPVPPAPAPAVATPPAALPWPAAAAESGSVQQAVDGGAQPWLLDPSEVALAYAAAAHGWDAAQAVAATDGSTVDLTGPDGSRRTLTLTQPATPGPTGIWVVTGDTPTP